MVADKRKVLIIGGQFSGTFAARDLKKKFHVTVVDMKEYFEYTPGILRAYVKPAHFDALCFTLQPVLERKMGVKFIWGEVKKLDGPGKTATIKTIFQQAPDTIGFDYCMICAGCNFGPFKPMGESLWFPTCLEKGREVSEWKHIDERFIEGRRRHILEEYHYIADLAKKKATVLVVGAGFIGVEWVTELEYFFPPLETTIMDLLPRCLGPLPDSAASYCSEYMSASGISEKYKLKHEPNLPKDQGGGKNQKFWDDVGLPNGVDKQYVCVGVKASNYFLEHAQEVLSLKGPLGMGGWIHFNKFMQVCEKPTPQQEQDGSHTYKVWGNGGIFAVGDCNYGCISNGNSNPCNWELPPVPKISYPGEEQALHAVVNLHVLDERLCHGRPNKKMQPTWWPWGAGMFATSLGAWDACFVLAATSEKGSGWMVNWWIWAALQKEVIETTKVAECKDNIIGKMVWHFVHHTPCNCWGKGPCCPKT